MFEIIETLDPDFDDYNDDTAKPSIEEDPNDDYSWLPLDRWEDRRVNY